MIKANDLRIGNWINEPTAICRFDSFRQVVELFKDTLIVQCNGSETTTTYYYLQGIPLTLSILEKCGFVQSNEFDDTFRLKEFDIHYRKGFCEWTVDDRGDNEGTKRRFIKYLHQLQNLFYAFTGEELQISMFENQTK